MHPKVREFYDQNKELDYVKSVQDNLEQRFNEQVFGEKTITVERIYRVKLGGFKSNEYVWYDQKEVGRDNAGNDMAFYRTVGKYDMPKAQWRFDGANKRELVGISDVQTEYDIPWSAKVIDDLEDKGMITGRTQCYVQTVSRTYGPFYIEAFKTSDFEDMAFAFSTPEQRQFLTGKKVTSTKQSNSATSS